MKDMNTARPQEGQWALITGASAGIGAEFCRQLAANKWSLVLVARREDRLQQLADELMDQHGIECVCITLDLADTSAPTRLHALLKEKGVEITLLVNNAGYGVPGKLTSVEWKAHADSLQVMLNSVCELCWLFLPAMQQRGRGYIINVSSLAGFTPGSAGHTLYGATKSFLISFSESMASENLDTGVAISALCPGFTYSEFHDVTGTRDLVNQMPGYMWKTAEEVVSYGLESVLREKPRVAAIPGRVNRLIATLIRLMPRSLALKMAQREARRFRSQENDGS